MKTPLRARFSGFVGYYLGGLSKLFKGGFPLSLCSETLISSGVCGLIFPLSCATNNSLRTNIVENYFQSNPVIVLWIDLYLVVEIFICKVKYALCATITTYFHIWQNASKGHHLHP